MKKIVSVLFFVLFVAVSGLQAKNDEKQVYLFGASISFTDSVVYFTEIMPVEGAKID